MKTVQIVLFTFLTFITGNQHNKREDDYFIRKHWDNRGVKLVRGSGMSGCC